MIELRQAFRQFLRAPGFTLMAAGTLALGIGAATAVFSVANGLLLRSLDYPEPDRIVRLLDFREDGSGAGTISSPNFFDWMEESETLAVSALYDEYRPTLGLGGMRALDAFLYGVSPTDPVIFIAAPLVLAATGLMACWIPARRAARLDPMTVLREE